ncbi:MAG TPA: outer membrane lipoprotein chaperone LolA [Burkholderiales bacterium]|nr:outer membrane lipoprotein chaperone LolA [Burkholderiales bacterium]
MRRSTICSVAGAALLACAFAVDAASTDRLKAFVEQTRSASADFSQTVVDRGGKKIQEASGNLQFSRPGKFRWTYDTPYQQLIVGDGSKLWIFDKDLNQVTARKLDDALGASPAALLAGDNAIEKNFELKNAAAKDGLEWLEATPKSSETTFERIRMGFKGADLDTMELKDQFGQLTVIRFTDLKRNPALSPELFRFTPPQGADVIGE